MKKRQLVLSTLAVALLALLPAAAQADPVTLTLPGTVVVTAGSSVTVIGTLANGGAPDFNISAWSINFDDPLLTFNDLAFLSSPLVLGAGETYGPTAFFDVFADISLAPGIYTGTFTIFDDVLQRNVTGTFKVQVEAVPEPISLALLGSGLGGLYLARRRKRNRGAKT